MAVYQPKFAPVAPAHILADLEAQKKLGDYHLLLAHETVRTPKAFQGVFSSYAARIGNAYSSLDVIMDNSIVELGGVVDDEMIEEAVQTILRIPHFHGRIYPVLGDVMGNGKETRKLSEATYERWTGVDNGKHMPGTCYMLVAQGENLEDFKKTVNYFFIDNKEDFPKIGWVGIPRKLTDLIGTRADAVRYLRMVAPHVKIHLLGFSKTIADDLLCARMSGVSGIDSAVPVRYNGILSPLTTDEEIGPRGDWMENGKLSSLHVYNIDNVRSWITRYS